MDKTCIDCDTCRNLDPQTFGWTGSGQSFVQRQPDSDDERHKALMALVSCPTASIGTEHKLDARRAAASLPTRVDASVYYCGYAAESSFGASSYLIVRSGGNVLVDSPRAAKPLMRRVEALGGVRFMFLTHRDDVADHAKWAEAFGCERVMHRDDLSHDTRGIEQVVEGDAVIALADGLSVIPVPGHTRGSTALLHGQYLFSGDHLWGTPDSRLSASKSVCWYSWNTQIRSVERLLEHDFEWVLPGHGLRYRAPSALAMRGELRQLIARMKSPLRETE